MNVVDVGVDASGAGAAADESFPMTSSTGGSVSDGGGGRRSVDDEEAGQSRAPHWY